MKENRSDRIKVIHTFSDGTVKKSVEGIIVSSEISEKIINILKPHKTFA